VTAAFLCRGPSWPSAKALPRAVLALGKGFTECQIKGPRQRPSLPSKNFPRALYRGPPSAKPLPRVFEPLPRARPVVTEGYLCH
jgi:hypothetical protein